MKTKIVSAILFAFYLIINSAFGQEALSIFEDFTDKEWVGHYQNSEDSNLIHIIKWEYDLDKHVVNMIKTVPELDFRMETIFYWDYEKNQISTLSLVNKAMISKGTVVKTDDLLEIMGKTFFNNGSQEYRQTFEISDDGYLQDYFYRKTNNNFIQGHFIKYAPK